MTCRCLTPRPRRGGDSPAFTLIELLAVLVIIGILAAVALPRLQGFGKGNAGIAATRQLLDDVAIARATAMASRARVYLVFVPPEITNWMLSAEFIPPSTTYSNEERMAFSNLVTKQYTAYAIYADRNIGDQPGTKNPRYLTPWKTLPDGVFIPVYKYQYANTDPTHYSNGVPPFQTNAFPFPFATSPPFLLPYIAFDYQGRLPNQRDETIPLARGSIFYPRGDQGTVADPFVADVIEKPLNNSINLSNHVRIDWLTGRAHVEHQELR